MTVPKTQRHPETRNNLPWYQVPVLWVCAGIFLLTMLACAHLIILSLEKAPVLPSENHRGNNFFPATSKIENPASVKESFVDEK